MRWTRRRLLGAGVAGAAALGGLWWMRSRRASERRVAPLPRARGDDGKPLNILLVVTDQERFDLPAALDLPGHARLAERGVTFRQYHVNTTPCSPSRSIMYFGQHPQHTKMVVNLGVFPEPQIPGDMPSLGDYLRAQGYYTAYKGKWHLSEVTAHFELTYGRYPNSVDALEPFGFSDFNVDGDPHGSTWTGYKYDGQIASDAVLWLNMRGKALANEKPWLLAVNFVNPHDVMYYSTGPSQVASRRHRDYLAPIAPAPVEAPYDREWGFDLPPSHGRDDLSSKPWAQRNYVDFCNMAFGRVPDTPEAWRAYQNYYFNCIRDADRHLVTLLDGLERSGLADRTVVVFTADHGEMAGAHGLRQKGPFMYQENVRVPFVVRHPDVQSGFATDALGSAVDLVPTLLDLAGADPKRVAALYPQLRGVSLAGAVSARDGRTERDRRGVLFNYDTTHYVDSEFAARLVDSGTTANRHMPIAALFAIGQPMPSRHNPALFRGIHDGRYKFARYFKPAEHHVPKDWDTLVKHNQLELYDTQADPGEIVNLAANPEAVKPTLLALNERLNALVATEVGTDLGDEQVGPAFMKQL